MKDKMLISTCFRSRSVLTMVIALMIALISVNAFAEDTPNSYVVTKIRFFPRSGHAAEMVGGKFVGSITSATNDFTDIAPISDPPAENQWTDLKIPSQSGRAFRFVKYQPHNGIWGDIAEIEFYAGNQKLTGTPFGTVGSGERENDPSLAFDGDTTTFFRGTNQWNQYVGLDLGAQSQVAKPVVSVPDGSYREAQTLKLSCSTPGAIIVYGADAWGPPGLDSKGKPVNGSIYTGDPIVISKSGIFQATAFKPGMVDSLTTFAAYHIGNEKMDPTEHAEFHIGNSLTDTVTPWMEPLAASGGHKIRFYRDTIPGAPTDWIWDHRGSGFGDSNYDKAFLARAPLTDLITQPFGPHNRSIDNEAEYSGRFFDLARKDSPHLQMWLYVQWPQADFSNDNWAKGVSQMDGKPLTFAQPAATWQQAAENHIRYTELVMDHMNKARAHAIEAGTCKPVLIIPGGLALAELRTRIEEGKVPGMTDFAAEVYHAPNDIHLSSKGAYLISLEHYACIYKDDPTGKVTAAGSSLTPEQAKIFQQIAWRVAREYRYSGIAGRR